MICSGFRFGATQRWQFRSTSLATNHKFWYESQSFI